jgi:hypothetical protein
MVDGKIETGSEEMEHGTLSEEPLNRHGENERSEQTSVEKWMPHALHDLLRRIHCALLK